jgi:hypothetical protein
MTSVGIIFLRIKLLENIKHLVSIQLFGIDISMRPMILE